jgi:hypothetical protein
MHLQHWQQVHAVLLLSAPSFTSLKGYMSLAPVARLIGTHVYVHEHVLSV